MSGAVIAVSPGREWLRASVSNKSVLANANLVKWTGKAVRSLAAIVEWKQRLRSCSAGSFKKTRW